MTDPTAARIVEVRIDVDSAPLLVVDGVPVDLPPGEDPEQAGMDLLADDARQAGHPVSAFLVLDGGSTRWAVQVHPDGTVTDDRADDAPPVPQRRRRPLVWLAGAASLAVLAGGGYAAVTVSTAGPDTPAAAGVAIPTWTADLPTSTERARPTTAPAATTTPPPEPAPVLVAAAPESVSVSDPSTPPTRAVPGGVRASATTEQDAPADPVPVQPAPAQQEPAAAALSDPAAGSSQRERSQRPSSSASATPGTSSSQRGQSGN